jgi:guanylate cyclase soluble subunit beta
MRFDQLLEEYPALYKLHTAGDSYTVVCNITVPCSEPVDVLLRYALELVKEAA